jgi:predicted MFS family arabinose efflux permease
MGIFNLATFLGLGMGPFLGGVISDHWHLQAAFASMGLLALTGCALSTLGLPPRKQEKAVRHCTVPVPWRHLLGRRDVLGLFLFRMAYTTCIGVIWGFLPIYADQSLHLSRSSIGALIMTGVLVSGLFHVPMGYLSDRISKPRMVVTGGLLAGFGVLTFIWGHSFAGMLVSSALFGMGGGIAMPALMGMAVAQGARSAAMGAVMALLTLGHSLGMMAGALMAGCFMDWQRLAWAFPGGAAVMVAGVLVFHAFSASGRTLPEGTDPATARDA